MIQALDFYELHIIKNNLKRIKIVEASASKTIMWSLQSIVFSCDTDT